MAPGCVKEEYYERGDVKGKVNGRGQNIYFLCPFYFYSAKNIDVKGKVNGWGEGDKLV